MNTPESDGNASQGGRDPPDVTLDYIARDLLSFFKGNESFNKSEMEHEHDCWPEDEIKRVWSKLQSMDKNSDERKDWSVIILQMIKSFACDKCKLRAVQEKCKPPSYSVQPSLSQGQAGNYHGAPDGQDRACLPNEGQQNRYENIYIRIPIDVLLNTNTSVERQAQPVAIAQPGANFKLIEKPPSPLKYLTKTKSYTVSFNDKTHNADWVYETLNREHLVDNVKGAFTHSFQRGHLAAVANHRWSQDALDDTYSESNIVPQDSTLNTGPWREAEKRSRHLTKQPGIRNVHVYSGPIYKRPMNPPFFQGKEVPSHFFKVIIVENEDGTVEEPECYEFPNGNLRSDANFGEENLRLLSEHRKHYEVLQRDSGLTFTEPRSM